MQLGARWPWEALRGALVSVEGEWRGDYAWRSGRGRRSRRERITGRIRGCNRGKNKQYFLQRMTEASSSRIPLIWVSLERVKRGFSNASSAIGIRATDHEI